jgi:hypothetical protein
MGHPCHNFVINRMPPQMLGSTKRDFAAAPALLVGTVIAFDSLPLSS